MANLLTCAIKKPHKYSHFLSKVNSTFDKNNFLINIEHFFIEYPLIIPDKTIFRIKHTGNDYIEILCETSLCLRASDFIFNLPAGAS